MKRQRKGFTLVELAIVIAILGILAVVAIPKYQGMEEEARSAAAKSQLGTVRSAIGIYYAKNRGTFPATISAGLFADGTVPGVDTGTGVVNTVVSATSDSPWAPPLTTAGGWEYCPTTGRVVINNTANDPATGVAWSSY
jgi:prepilin-type N-terminal cleavage/methylation domain-containing protein